MRFQGLKCDVKSTLEKKKGLNYANGGQNWQWLHILKKDSLSIQSICRISSKAAAIYCAASNAVRLN